MTQDEIIEMARQAEFFISPIDSVLLPKLEFFAKLVAQHEREACARVCETLWNTPTNGMATEDQSYGSQCAEAIRARGRA
jgi:hypothetical protein